MKGENYEYKKNKFTIHFATINTNMQVVAEDYQFHLQYTLLLLIQGEQSNLNPAQNHLQYTLLLLIPDESPPPPPKIENLQYTLLLLIR